MNADETWKAVEQVFLACATRPTPDQLTVLGIAWLAVASNVRTEALVIPGGFPKERDRQVALLRAMAEMVAGDEPDLEGERLFQEGDMEGFGRHMLQRFHDQKARAMRTRGGVRTTTTTGPNDEGVQ